VIENSSAGLVMLQGEVTVAVTREEHHQAMLSRYPVTMGAQRHVAVELGWCTIASGKYRGETAIEVRLDGRRIGELTYAMSRRYAPLITQLANRGGRLGCEALIQQGAKGLAVNLRLPRHAEGAVALPTPAAVPAPSLAPQRRRGVFASHRPIWIGAAVVAVIFVVAIANNNDDSPRTTTVIDVGSTTTATPPPTTTTVAPTTTPPVVPTTVAPAPEPPAPQQPSQKTTTKRVTPAPPPPPVEPAPPAPPVEPAPTCDPNYSGCVPIASDVDCAGGSGNGPAYVAGPIRVVGSDIYDLDRDGDGIACE
jgi:hypothetical protein